eukprot:scaffold431_cov334-Pavlova_lutheri.AAC.21
MRRTKQVYGRSTDVLLAKMWCFYIGPIHLVRWIFVFILENFIVRLESDDPRSKDVCLSATLYRARKEGLGEHFHLPTKASILSCATSRCGIKAHHAFSLHLALGV